MDQAKAATAAAMKSMGMGEPATARLNEQAAPFSLHMMTPLSAIRGL
jgi:hypothetical protein